MDEDFHEDAPGEFPGGESIESPAPKPMPKINKRILAIVIVGIVIVAGIAVAMPTILNYVNQALAGGLPITIGEKTQMLVIGQPSIGLLADLDNQRDLVYYRVKYAADLDIAPKEQIEQYDIILLDQHLGTTPLDKSVSRSLGEAIENYVMTGGKLIVVMDSGIYRSGGIYGGGIATDVVGWKPNFGNLMPVECDTGQNQLPTCTQPVPVTGTIERLDPDSKIMFGIEKAPADPRYGQLSLITFDVKPIGNEIAIIDSGTAKAFPGIVEKRLLVGKCIYFNYDPALTQGIWQNTLEYLS